MKESPEQFLSRWSRRKVEAREAPAAPPAEPKAEAPAQPEQPLPAVESLTPESDFKPFMGANVEPQTRQAALKKLFTDAHFNAPDPYEAYSGDYTQADPIPMALLKTLNHARKLAFTEAEQAEQAAEQAALAATETKGATQPDVPPVKDA